MMLHFLRHRDRGRSHPLRRRLVVVGTPIRITDEPAQVSAILTGLVEFR